MKMTAVIRTVPNPALSSVADPVPEGVNVSGLLDIMWPAMYQNRGVGLAANQIGVLQRVIVIHAGGLKQEFINPVITKHYGGKGPSKEGCLSVPGVALTLSRHRRVVVEGFDKNWKPIKRKLKGIAAFCVQHEIDHLNGITLADYAKDPKAPGAL